MFQIAQATILAEMSASLGVSMVNAIGARDKLLAELLSMLSTFDIHKTGY